jgi:hypothetical protein
LAALTKIIHRNSTFTKQKVLLDGNEYHHCKFTDCLIVIGDGDVVIERCSFSDCKLLLQGKALTIGKLIQAITMGAPMKVLDFDLPQPWEGKPLPLPDDKN